jgi:glyceraldehyde 3-phosphate dehydrogenase
MAIRIALNGFGRIGRQITRLLCSEYGAGIELKAINTLESIDCAAHLLRHDSNHGPFGHTVAGHGHELFIADQAIRFLNQPEPSLLPWRELGIDVVIEASGQLTHRPQACQHRKAGAAKVLITAAAHDPDLTLCLGVNQDAYQTDRHHIISASSCTTNCLAPVAKLINDRFTIHTGLATFLHSYTSSHNLLDVQRGDDLRRMRATGKNIIPTTTSANHQLPEVIPALRGKFAAVAIRVPTPEVHLASFTALVDGPTTREEVMALFTEAAQGLLHGILAVSALPLVSIDFKGSAPSAILDAETIQVMGGNMIQLMIWHDNESSYCKRIIDLVRYVATDQDAC